MSKRKGVEAELEAANGELSRLATTDELTGINSHRELNRLLDLEAQRRKRERTALFVLLIDVDHFKLFNDTHGHLKGDRCLKEIASAISVSIRRPADLCVRYGGERTVSSHAIALVDEVGRQCFLLQQRSGYVFHVFLMY